MSPEMRSALQLVSSKFPVAIITGRSQEKARPCPRPLCPPRPTPRSQRCSPPLPQPASIHGPTHGNARSHHTHSATFTAACFLHASLIRPALRMAPQLRTVGPFPQVRNFVQLHDGQLWYAGSHGMEVEGPGGAFEAAPWASEIMLAIATDLVRPGRLAQDTAGRRA